MKILAIETSCDDTSIALIQIDEPTQQVTVLSHITSSQTALHTQYGGVFPLLAKREHAHNIVPIFEQTLRNAGMYKEIERSNETVEKIQTVLTEIPQIDPDMALSLSQVLAQIEIPTDIDYICVTTGPGLEMTLWVGINFATAVSTIWNIPLVPVNHMEGHICSISATGENMFTLHEFQYPYMALLISGGHTELVLAHENKYEIIGKTKDDAVGEAFDKVARLLDLPYPGGPEISRLAKIGRESNYTSWIALPRPMIHSKDFDFSFSGIKTAVLYAVQKKQLIAPLTDQEKIELAMEFENAVAEVIVKKLSHPLVEYQPQEIIIAGGVSANRYIKEQVEEKIKKDGYTIPVYFPHATVTGDNALMIALAGYKNISESNLKNKKPHLLIKADGGLSL